MVVAGSIRRVLVIVVSEKALGAWLETASTAAIDVAKKALGALDHPGLAALLTALRCLRRPGWIDRTSPFQSARAMSVRQADTW